MSEKVFPHYNDQFTRIAGGVVYSGGLTKRELFAGLAMQGCLAQAAQADFVHNNIKSFMRHLPGVAVSLADALIAELAKPQQEKT